MRDQGFTLEHFNHIMLENIKGQDVDFCHMISCALKDKLSVVAEYDPIPECGYFLTLGEDGIPEKNYEFSEYYYGVSPKIDSNMIIEGISNLEYSNLNKLDAFILRNRRLFMCHAEQGQYLKDFARYTVLAICSNYGLCIHWDCSFEEICNKLDPAGKILERKDDQLWIRGCPTDQILESFSKFTFCMGKEVWEISPTGEKNIYDLYQDTENIRLINGTVFYSGVVLRPIMIEEVDKRYENMAVDALRIYFERSTYATIFSLDGNFLYHPILTREIRENLSSMLYYDDDCKRKLIESLSRIRGENIYYTKEGIRIINYYLKNCINVNQINVSANVITQDEFLLLGKRNATSIDSGNLYPGVNGNCEVADKNVSFYKSSVYEDYPTIHLDNSRIDFMGEINREAYAELRLCAPKQEWICCGIIISGNKPAEEKNDSYSLSYRRMHFNIIFEHKSNDSFKYIRKDSAYALEAFENERIMGLQMKYFRSIRDLIQKKIVESCKKVVEFKDVWESVLLLILAFSIPNSFHGEINEYFSLIFSCLVSILTILKVISYMRNSFSMRKITKKILIFERKPLEKTENKIKKSLIHYRYHPVTLACILLYVEKQIYDLWKD